MKRASLSIEKKEGLSEQNRVRRTGQTGRVVSRAVGCHPPRQVPRAPPKSPPSAPQQPRKQDARRRESQSRVRGAGRGKTGRVAGAPLELPHTPSLTETRRAPHHHLHTWGTHTLRDLGDALRDLRETWRGRVRMPRHSLHLRVVDTLTHQVFTSLANTVVRLHSVLMVSEQLGVFFHPQSVRPWQARAATRAV